MPPEGTAANPTQGGELTGNEGAPKKQQSFRERAESRLRSERQPRGESPAQQPRPTQDTSQRKAAAKGGPNAQLEDAGPVEELPEDELELEEGTDDSEESTETADGDDVAEPEEGSIEFYQQKLDKAEESRKNLERDYRLKTHQFGSLRRELQDQTEQVKGQYVFLLNAAANEVKRFETVNWELLKVQDPRAFEAQRAGYTNAVKAQQQLGRAFQQIQQRHQEMIERAQARETEISKETLKTFIPGWNKERFLSLRELANQEAFYTPEEFDKLTDWRPVMMLNRIMELQGAPKTPADVKAKRKLRHKPGGPQQNVARERNTEGKFVSTRSQAFDRPGDRQSFRQMKIAQLARERARRG